MYLTPYVVTEWENLWLVDNNKGICVKKGECAPYKLTTVYDATSGAVTSQNCVRGATTVTISTESSNTKTIVGG
jgi:hypothetical protein